MGGFLELFISRDRCRPAAGRLFVAKRRGDKSRRQYRLILVMLLVYQLPFGVWSGCSAPTGNASYILWKLVAVQVAAHGLRYVCRVESGRLANPFGRSYGTQSIWGVRVSARWAGRHGDVSGQICGGWTVVLDRPALINTSGWFQLFGYSS